MTDRKDARAKFNKMGITVKAPLSPIPTDARALLVEAQHLFKAGQKQKALALAEKATKLSTRPDIRAAFATMLLLAGDPTQAENNYRVVLREKPDFFSALLGLGQLTLNASRGEEAIQLLEAAVRVDPRSIDARHLLARSYGLNRRSSEAVALFETLIKEAPTSAQIWAGYARALAKTGPEALNRAIEAYEKAAVLNPNDDAIHQGLASAYLTIGEIEKAERHSKKAVKLRPDRGIPYVNLARLKALDGHELDQAEQELARLPSGDPKRLTFLSAIVRMAEAVKNYERSFTALREAWDIRWQISKKKYRPDLVDALTEDLVHKTTFLPRFPSNAEDLSPIFILGMPRCGSTLTEQVLDRHPFAFGVGEINAMSKTAAFMDSLGKIYPQGLPILSADNVAELRKAYYRNLPEIPAGKKIVVDKSLGSVFHLPLIEVVFPHARIIRCRRHPMDICWSILIQLFDSNDVPYGNRIEDVCHHMLQQHRVLEAWSERKTLAIFDLFYEEFVERFESTVLSLINFAGLEWNDECLRPQDSRRAVLTASAGQVHKPITKSSVGRWKPFAPYLVGATTILQPLIDLHEQELANRGISYS
jgi:tetratricopeptide (TPR) repeat protein